jgi:hypothetical protein
VKDYILESGKDGALLEETVKEGKDSFTDSERAKALTLAQCETLR